MRHLLALFAVASCALAMATGDATATARATLVVDDDGAQCKTSYTTIQEAVDDAQPGAQIRVCPGFYAESVTVEKEGVTLTATQPAVEDPLLEPEVGAGSNCFDPVLTVDQAHYAIVDPENSGPPVAAGPPLENAFGFKLRANGIVIRGFVIQGAWVGVDAGDGSSGYRISKNLIRGNSYFGIEFGSSGEVQSRVDHNCFRENAVRLGEVGGGLGAELDDPYGGLANRSGNYRELKNARIDHNDTYRNNEAVAVLARGPYVNVKIDHNRQLDDRFGIAIQNSTRSTITGNVVVTAEVWPVRRSATGAALAGSPLLVAALNTQLLISSNTFEGGVTSVTFLAGGTLDPTLQPSTGVVFRDNSVSGAARTGVAIATATATGLPPFPSLVDSLFENNTSNDNGFHGFFVRARNTGNTFRANTADGNDGNGIWAEVGAVANTFEANSMHGNGTWEGPPVPPNLTFPLVDARDDNPWNANTWLANDCDTDNHGGLICGVG